MQIISSTFHLLKEYLDGTYSSQMFILAMELGIIAISLSQANLEVFGELNDFFIRWHTLFLGPIAIGECLLPLFDTIWPGGKMPNLMISILSLIEISLFPKSQVISICFLLFVCLIYLIDNANSMLMVLISILFGFSFYILKEIIEPSPNNNLPFSHSENLLHTISFIKYDFNECIYSLTLLFTIITILTQFRANNIKDTNNYHSNLIRNLGFIAFDSIIHYHGTEDVNNVLFAFFSDFSFVFLSKLMESYRISFSFF